MVEKGREEIESGEQLVWSDAWWVCGFSCLDKLRFGNEMLNVNAGAWMRFCFMALELIFRSFFFFKLKDKYLD